MAIIDTPSRLTKSSEELRFFLETRNLYTEFDQYPPAPSQTKQIIASVDSVLNIISPFRSLDLQNSAIARVVSTPNTPLVDIGLLMLGKQFGDNFSSNLAQQTFPSFRPLNMFKKGSKIFEPNVNFTITNTAASGRTDVSQFLQRFLSFTKPSPPLDVNWTNSYLVERTGGGQLDFLFGDGKTTGGINFNIYKPKGTEYYRAAAKIDIDVADRGNLTSDKVWFNFINQDQNPYISILPFKIGEDDANKKMISAYNDAVLGSNNVNQTQEYAPTQSFIDDYLGKTNLNEESINIGKQNIPNYWISDDGIADNNGRQIVWGRDGIDQATAENLTPLRGLNNRSVLANNAIDDTYDGKFGLLQYTKNLLNATGGQVVDQTRKVFTNGDKIEGFNGSGLWQANNSEYAQRAGFDDNLGVRQHSPMDQYDRFAKAIRFDGNIAYEGNENSVVYKTVMPRIHPTLNDDDTGAVVNNKDLIFSIENLAVGVTGDDKKAYVEDEFGTEIPISEKGPFGGRLMWFPPYGLELNETANAKYDSTVMVGRGEPIYTYMHSERSANLSFVVLMDYPPQVRNYRGGKHKDIAEFFAFGGDDYNSTDVEKDVEKLEFDLQLLITQLGDEGTETPPDIKLPRELKVVFPNDLPETHNNGTIVNDMYNSYWYEIDERVPSSDGTSFGLNGSFIYNTSGFTYSENPNDFVLDVPYVDQYSVAYSVGERELDDSIYKVFNDPDSRKYYKIVVVGAASKLFNGPDEKAYNEELGLKRAEATKIFLEKRITAIFGKTALKDIKIEFGAGDGSTGSDKSKEKNATEDKISAEETKLERNCRITFDETGIEPPKKSNDDLSSDDKQRIIDIKIRIEFIKKQIKEKRLRLYENSIYTERESSDNSNEDDGILKGYQAIIDGKFYPVFHSQTPEDFHRRLTFLHQCTRQGEPLKTELTKDGNGVERARNSVFGKQPICVLRIADFIYSKVIIETITFDYVDATWDVNPEGFGMQPMIAKVNVQMKVIGGQSLKGPIDALQNAVSYNFYANSSFSDKGIYILPAYNAAAQNSYNEGVSWADFQQSDAAKAFNTVVKERRDSKNE